jgi:inner membrane protein
MMGHTHALIGSGVGLLIAVATGASPEMAAALSGTGALVALLPDIDHPQSPIRRRMGILGSVFSLVKHRGITHTLIAEVVVAIAALALLPRPLAIAAVFGYASHILADMMTIRGVPVLWPLNKDELHILPKPIRITTNGLIEAGLALLLAAGQTYLVYRFYGNAFIPILL